MNLDWVAIRDFLTSVGFPIFVAVYFMVKMQRILEMLTLSINDIRALLDQNKQTIAQLCEKINTNSDLMSILLKYNVDNRKDDDHA